MSDFMSLCLKRQSCRDFADRVVEEDKLIKCIEAARLAPSACNSQPWSFVVAKTPEVVEEIAKSAGILGRNGFAMGAKAFLVIVEEHAVLMPLIRGLIDSQYFAASDIGGSIAHICLEAQDQGLATCILGLFDKEKVAEILDIPKQKRIRAMIATGYPKEDTIREKKRKDIKDIMTIV